MIDYKAAGYMDNAELWQLALEIDANHAEQDYRRCDPYPTREMKGLVGARRLAHDTGGKMDTRVLGRGGDGHVDQWLDFPKGRYPADVKCAVNPDQIIVSVDDMQKVLYPKDRPYSPTIFVIGQLLNHDQHWMHWDCELLKWNWDCVLRRSIPKTHGHGILNYWVKARESRDISELLALLAMKDFA